MQHQKQQHAADSSAVTCRGRGGAEDEGRSEAKSHRDKAAERTASDEGQVNTTGPVRPAMPSMGQRTIRRQIFGSG